MMHYGTDSNNTSIGGTLHCAPSAKVFGQHSRSGQVMVLMISLQLRSASIAAWHYIYRESINLGDNT